MENIHFDNAETSHVTTKTTAGANCDCNYTSTGCTKKCPEIMSLNSGELIEWMRNRKKQLGLTNAKLAEMSNVPEGTIDRILSQRYSEFRYSSIPALFLNFSSQIVDDAFHPFPMNKNIFQHSASIIIRIFKKINLSI